MKKNKLILFDWGGIVEDPISNHKAWNLLMSECGATDLSKLIYYDLTSISNESDFRKVYDNMKTVNSLTASFDEFVEKYLRIFDSVVYYIDVRDYEISLRDKCYIGILSNLNMYARNRIDKQLGLSNYDYVFLSFELACKKPNIEIFEKVQEQLPFDKSDILFIDDKNGNIETAKNFGWNTFQATGLELDKIKNACESFIDE